MKKNITINLYGSLYAIDEDACSLLERYLENMKRYFSKRDGGEEIADDIEHRVAELFAELHTQGVAAVSIEHVQDIIRRIGNPEEMEGEEGDSPAESSTGEGAEAAAPADDPEEAATPAEEGQPRAPRKLYRDTEDKMLGGVMSGLCHYFGANDPLPWRLLFVVLCFISFSAVAIIYLVAWAVIPAAQTAEQRLEMYGRPVNASTLAEEVVRGARQGAEYLGSEQFQGKARGCLGTLLRIFLFLVKLFLLFATGICTLVALAYTALLVFGTLGGAQVLIEADVPDADFVRLLCANPWLVAMLWGIALCTLTCLALIVYGLVRSLLRRPGDRPMPQGTRITLVVIALLCATAALTLTALSASLSDKASEQQWRAENTRDGILLDPDDRAMLAERSWRVLKLDNCDDDGEVYDWIDPFIGYGKRVSYLKFEREEDELPMRVQLERSTQREAGWYHLEAIGFSKGMGAYVYAKPDSGRVVSAMLPVDDSQGRGNMSRMSREEVNGIAYFNGEVDSLNWYSLTASRVNGWSFVRSASFYHRGGSLTIGTTNLPGVVGQPAGDGEVGKYGLFNLSIIPDSAATQPKPVVKHPSPMGKHSSPKAKHLNLKKNKAKK